MENQVSREASASESNVVVIVRKFEHIWQSPNVNKQLGSEQGLEIRVGLDIFWVKYVLILKDIQDRKLYENHGIAAENKLFT